MNSYIAHKVGITTGVLADLVVTNTCIVIALADAVINKIHSVDLMKSQIAENLSLPTSWAT